MSRVDELLGAARRAREELQKMFDGHPAWAERDAGSLQDIWDERGAYWCYVDGPMHAVYWGVLVLGDSPLQVEQAAKRLRDGARTHTLRDLDVEVYEADRAVPTSGDGTLALVTVGDDEGRSDYNDVLLDADKRVEIEET